MTTLAEQATLTSTDAVAVESSSTSPRSTTQNSAQTITAAGGSASASSSSVEVEVVSVSGQTSDPDEIETISRQIRRVLECPICLTLMSVISCYCPNGHAVCEPCMTTLLNMNSTQENPCPLCRTLMLQSLGTSATVVKLTELTTLVKVTCSNRQHGCTELIPVRYVSDHESECPHVPTVRCQVTICQWLGMYEQLFEHVSSSHPGVTVRTVQNQLKVDNLKDIIWNRRRTYLVQSTFGMIWVMMSRIARSRIQAALFMVNKHRSENNDVDKVPPDIRYRITCFDENDRLRTKSRTRVINWSTLLQSRCHNILSGVYTTFRVTTIDHMVINWFRYPMNNRNRIPTTY
ncbi:E3 ubiquitin-protein ligase sina-like isoform X1 [Aphis craccivora]|uniref:E3 ubiquitin-protein ligase sina-like isoform X1 n=1 Tax=Aphis craccivora TaxID=307492 RepID=A0A6G0Y8U6_APHCR|nr:E3 ubiquitin-protein ligase sina-like isoform X1 [Aphis craccivora]